MQEGAVMEIVKWFLGLFMLLLLISLTIFAINVSSVNNFKQQVNYEIERNGGYTEQAKKGIEEYSDKYYQGRFKIVEPGGAQGKVEFGDKVDYTVETKMKMVIFDLPFEMKFKGTAVSYVR